MSPILIQQIRLSVARCRAEGRAGRLRLDASRRILICADGSVVQILSPYPGTESIIRERWPEITEALSSS